MHIQNRISTSKTAPAKGGPTLYRPEKTGVFHGLRFHTLISDFQSEDIETYLTTKPNILNYGSSGDMIIDLTNTKYLEREQNQILRFFRDMPSGSTFTVNNAEYYDPYKDLDLTSEVKSSNDLLNGVYTFNKFEKGKYLLFVNKLTWTDQKINKYLGQYFIKTPQFSKSTYQSITVTGDNYHVIENNIGLPAESFQMFDFSENDTIQIFNSSNNNEKYKVKKLVTDSVTGVERLYLDEATGLTMEDNIGSAIILNKLVKETQAASYQSYVEPITTNKVVHCSSLNIKISSVGSHFGLKYSVNGGRKNVTRGTLVLGRSNTYRISFEGSVPPLYFSETPDGTNNAGKRMTTGVRTVGQNGHTNSYIELTIDDTTPKYIYYYNESTPNMGGRIQIVDECGGIVSADERRYVEVPSGSGVGNNTSTTASTPSTAPVRAPMPMPSPPSPPTSGAGAGY